MCLHRGRLEEFKDLFSQKDGVLFWNDICSVKVFLGHEYNPDQRHLFIDSSRVNLKVVLLHNGSRFLSAPLSHAAYMKERYEGMKLLLGMIEYDEFKWKLCGDRKVVGTVTRYATRVHKILLFPVRVGQQGQEESLCK